MLGCLFTSGCQTCTIVASTEGSVLSLNADTAEHDFWILIWVGGLAADFASRMCCQVKENLTIKNTIFVKIKNLWVTTLFGDLNFFLFLVFFSILSALFS